MICQNKRIEKGLRTNATEGRIRYNQSYIKSTNVVAIRVSRFIGAGQVKQMNANDLSRTIMECKPEGLRNRKPPKLR